MKKIHLLFVCTFNAERSPMAASLFVKSRKYEAKSAGISESARVRINQELIDWADKIFVMSEKEGQLSFLIKNFNIKNKELYNLDINENAVREVLKNKISKYVDKGEMQ